MMETYLKRTTVDNGGSPSAKKARKEECPHSVKCYRRNPQHFKEYSHEFLEELANKSDNSFELPEGHPQTKLVVAEQVAVIRDVKGIRKRKANVGEKAAQKVASAQISKTEASGSNARLSSRGKPTNFATNRTSASSLSARKTMAEKMKENAPYNLFFTEINDSPNTLKQKNSVTFSDLVCLSLGDLKCSLQLNFMIDIMWLMEQYAKHGQNKKPMTMVYGDDWPDMEKYISMMLPNVTSHRIKMKDPFGIHHSKVGIYVYTDNSIRVVVSTANLYYEDWNHYCQGLWVSPSCPRLPETAPASEGAGPTKFKTTLLAYLQEYKLPILNEFVSYVKRADFSAVKVFLVASVPGKHTAPGSHASSHLHSVGDVLSKHCVLPEKTTPDSEGPLSWGVIAQSSSIGSLGKTPADWLRSGLLRSLSSHKKVRLPSNSSTPLSVIFPSVRNVLGSYYGPQGGGCLPYSKSTNDKQPWFKSYLHQWKANHTDRSRNMPHIKTYCRVSPCMTKLAWFLITSANISKAAWGSLNKDMSVYIRSFEVGVVFVPGLFDEDYFTIKDGGGNEFPFIYDLPLKEYEADDTPWCN